jgi:cardiolipin synthase A/B
MGIALASIALTLLAVLLLANFVSPEKTIERQVERLYDVDDAQFRRSLAVLLGPDILEGNHVQLLRNGDEIFPAMLASIERAKTTVCFETFIYWSGDIGRAFADALCRRAHEGVKVHVLLDWLGSTRMDSSTLAAMERSGVQVQRYHRPGVLRLRRMNNRTHRKLLVIDGMEAFTGGVGIADQWTGHAQDPDHWRDSHYQVRGPVVAQMQAAFLDNWIKVTGCVLHGDSYFPQLSPAGRMPAQMFSSSPSGGSESMHMLVLLSIAAARESILLQSAYFVPDRLAVQALVAAAKRGVKIKILVPGTHTDEAVVRRASRALWGKLLEAGVELAEYQPTMIHCKMMVVDRLLVSVGSTNFDNRSFRLNDEANLNVLDADFAAEQVKVFEEDWAHAQPMSLEAWRGRPVRQRLLENAAALLRRQL